MGAGWLAAIAALGCTFAAWQDVAAWSADARGGPAAPSNFVTAAAPWLLLIALALTGASLLIAL
jgi:hypothetical protein